MMLRPPVFDACFRICEDRIEPGPPRAKERATHVDLDEDRSVQRILRVSVSQQGVSLSQCVVSGVGTA